MKASITFDRWVRRNLPRITAEGKAFSDLVKKAALDLKGIEGNPKGLSARDAAARIGRLAKLKAEIAKRGLPEPKIKLPKIKVVHPRRM